MANSKITPTLCYEGGTPGYYIRQSILKIPSPLLQGLSIHYCGITIFFAQSSPLIRRTCFLHVSRSTGAFAQAPFGRVRSPVVPLIGGAIWWVAELQTVLLSCILQQIPILKPSKEPSNPALQANCSDELSMQDF
ncbi:hypothetical protein AVEN_93062-1 [Araneus ventricosus]|uniref:Uncharacterized protein n=1 Tax=Araneus ventricosus TaxID=182803 RepID=A0A4Y2Q202_ARAVE|nr:hypothetical protein AVEN_93062-1 [Araneus ventricosus]